MLRLFRRTLMMSLILFGVVLHFLEPCYGSTEVRGFSWKKDSSITDYMSTSGYLTSQHVRSRYACGWECFIDNICRAFFYNQNTGLCVTEDTIRTSIAGLNSMPGTSYYALTNAQLAEKMCAPQYTEDFQLVQMTDNSYIQIRFFNEFRNWADARANCAFHGGTLFQPTSATKHQLILDLFQCQGLSNYYWADGKKDSKCDPWTTWGYTHSYTTGYWQGSNPDNPETEMCMEIVADGLWNSKLCHDIIRYICEKPA